MPAKATKTSGVEPARTGWREPLRRVPASVLLGAGIISVQVGAGFAGRLFGTVSPAGITGLRLWAACLLFVAFGGRSAGRTLRGIVTARAWRDAAIVVGFGLTLGVMNFAIYQSFARIPLGIAVTIEFLGPLGVAVATSRRLIDLAWVALAALGVTLLGTAGVGAATFDGVRHGGSVLAGVAYALVAAGSWACYIMLSAATGRRFSGPSGLVIAIIIGALLVTPVAVVSAGASLIRPGVLAAGLLIGLLSSVIPYRFELESLQRVPARVFGIWMSLEPAVAALVGVVLLSQQLSVLQWLAIGCVMAATAGAALHAATVPQA